MPWFMVDDAINTDEKVLALDPQLKAEAMGTWVLCGAWSSQRLKDGSVPKAIVTAMGGTDRGAEALVATGLWKKARGGYRFHNWEKFQRTKAQVEARRVDEAERKRKYRESKGQVKPENVPDLSQRDTTGVPGVSGHPIPAHPSPSQPLNGLSDLGGSPKQGAEFAPQACGRSHDPAKSCGACATARREASNTDAAVERETNKRQRTAQTQERLARQAEAAATEPASPEFVQAAIAKVRAATKEGKS